MTFGDAALERIRGLILSGEFEDAEAGALDLMKRRGDDHALALVYATACIKQLAYDKTAENACGMLRRDGLVLGQKLLFTRLLCIAFAGLGAADMARPYIDRLQSCASPHCSDHCWPGRLLLEIAEPDEALFRLGRLEQQFPGDPFLRYCMGVARLSLGDSAGFVDALQFASRAFWAVYYPGATHADRMWEGEPLDGKAVAVVIHGGYGDYIRSARHVADLRRLGATRVVAVAWQPVHGLLHGAGFDEMLGIDRQDEARAETDVWTGAFGLERTRCFGAEQGRAQAYLAAAPAANADNVLAAARHAAAGRACLGLYWHSDASGGESRSVPLHDLMPLLSMPGIHWVILQRGFGLRRLRLAGLESECTIVDASLDLSESAAVIAGLDGVVTIDAWACHAAGAQGVRTWVLAPRALDARYENRERHSVHYPGIVTLARQPACGDWRGAVRILSADLAQWLRERAGETA